MERPYTTNRAHMPGPRGSTADTDSNQPCPNEGRIGAIESRLSELEGSFNDLGQRFDEIDLTVPVVTVTEDKSNPSRDDDRIEFIAKRINAIESRIVQLENRPYVSEETVQGLNDALHAKMQSIIEKTVNRSLGDLRSRVVTIEKTSSSVTHSEGERDADSTKLARIAEIVQSLGGYVREIESTVVERHDELEQRYAELAEHITDNNLKTMQLNTRLYRALAALEHDEEAA